MSSQAFWSGFMKQAEAYVSAPGDTAGPAERTLLWNEQGGVNPRSPEDQQAALASNLVTLPMDVEGANCLSCAHFRQLDADMGTGFCTNPQLKQDVTSRMVCAMWENPGSHSGAEEQMAAEEQQAQQREAPMSEGIMQDIAQPDQAAGTPGQADPTAAAPGGQIPQAGEQETNDQAMGNATPGGAVEGGAPAGGSAPAPKKPKEKKEPKGDGHTINVNVGEKKTASVARISQILARLGRTKKRGHITTSSSFKTRRK